MVLASSGEYENIQLNSCVDFFEATMSQTATQKLRLQAFSESPSIESRKPPSNRSQRLCDASSIVASCATEKRPICVKDSNAMKSEEIEIEPNRSSEQNKSPGSHRIAKRQNAKRCQRSRTLRMTTTTRTEKYNIKSLSDEVLLEIFSYVKEKELCRLSQVCSRFDSICQDGSLWRSLYIRSFSLNKLLIKSSSGNYEEKESENDDGWKKCFQTLHGAHHVCVKTSMANNCHSTIDAAIKAIPGGGVIMVHGGVYEESLKIDKPVDIIGAAFGDREAVVIQSKSSPAITFSQGSSGAFLGHLTVKNVDAASSETNYQTRHDCIEVKEDCAPVIFNCKLHSQSSAGATIYVHGKGSRPAVRKCTIADSENVGIFITDGAQGTFEECEITNTKLAGVWVRNHASPIMRRNCIHHSRDVGLFIFDSGLGYYEANDVHSNRIAGFEIRSGANPTVVGCKIHHGMTGGIYCHDDARGEFLENQIYSNTYAGVWITSHSNPTIKNNEIYDGQQGGVYIFGDGRGLIEGNNIHDNALAGIQIRTKSNPIVRCNKIHNGLHGGLYVHENGLGLIEDNEIFCNTLAGVWITTGSAPTLRHNRIHSGKQVGVYFYDAGCGTLEENEIFHHKYSGIQIRSGSNPLIRKNKIWGGQNGGVLVYNQGLGLLEENEIFDNAMAGVWIKTESNPVLRRNKIHDGREGGVCILNRGKGVLEENDIFRNSATGVLISTSSHPVLKGNRVFDCGAAGIEITNNAGGTLEGNEVFNNRFDGICLASDVQPKLIDNKVYNNKCEIKHAVENEQCLFKVSRRSCLPLHDLFRCFTCRTAGDYAVCLSCVGKCHVGHQVEFLRRDRFVCDCGAGSSGVQCKLVGDNSWSSSTAVRGSIGRSGVNDMRVQPLNCSLAH